MSPRPLRSRRCPSGGHSEGVRPSLPTDPSGLQADTRRFGWPYVQRALAEPSSAVASAAPHCYQTVSDHPAKYRPGTGHGRKQRPGGANVSIRRAFAFKACQRNPHLAHLAEGIRLGFEQALATGYPPRPAKGDFDSGSQFGGTDQSDDDMESDSGDGNDNRDARVAACPAAFQGRRSWSGPARPPQSSWGSQSTGALGRPGPRGRDQGTSPHLKQLGLVPLRRHSSQGGSNRHTSRVQQLRCTRGSSSPQHGPIREGMHNAPAFGPAIGRSRLSDSSFCARWAHSRLRPYRPTTLRRRWTLQTKPFCAARCGGRFRPLWPSLKRPDSTR